MALTIFPAETSIEVMLSPGTCVCCKDLSNRAITSVLDKDPMGMQLASWNAKFETLAWGFWDLIGLKCRTCIRVAARGFRATDIMFRCKAALSCMRVCRVDQRSTSTCEANA